MASHAHRKGIGWRIGMILLLLAVGVWSGCQIVPPAPGETPTPQATPAASATPPPADTPAATSTPASAPGAGGTALSFSYVAARSDGASELHLADAAGDHLLAVDEEGFSSLRWSPDGGLGLAIVRVGDQRALIVVDVAARQASALFSVAATERLDYMPAADWSRLALRRQQAPLTELWAIDVPGGQPRRLSQTAGAVSGWSIAGDGDWLLASLEAEGHFVNTLFRADGSQAGELPALAHPLAEFSQNGRWLIVAGQESGAASMSLRVVDLDSFPAGDAVRVVAQAGTVAPAVAWDADLTQFLSLDGEWLSCRLLDGDSQRLRVRHLTDGVRLDEPLAAEEQLAWVLVYGASQRAVMAIEREGVARLRLLYLDQQSGTDLVRDLRQPRFLSAHTNSTLVATGLLADGQRQVWLVNIAQGTARLAAQGFLRVLDVDAGGQRALVAMGAPTSEEVHVLDLRTGGTWAYLGRSSGGPGQVSDGAFAPAGTAVWARLWDGAGRANLMLSRQANTPAVELAQGVAEAVFSPDGQTVLYIRQPATGGGIHLAGLDGVEQRTLGGEHFARWHAAP